MYGAAVVELVDTLDSKSCGSNTVTVQVRPAAPRILNIEQPPSLFSEYTSKQRC